MKLDKINAVNLRIILCVVISTTALFSIFGFYYAQEQLKVLAQEVHDLSSKNTNGYNANGNNQAIQNLVANNQSVSIKANNISTSPQTYANTIKQDLTTYANSTGISISNFTQPAISETQSFKTINGLSNNFQTITIKNPVKLTNFLKFLKLIESNLPIMQVTGINITPVKNNNESITVDPLIIQVYTR